MSQWPQIWSFFSGHLSKVHDMSIPEYTEKYGELVTVHKFHECRICNCSYIHNKPAISRSGR